MGTISTICLIGACALIALSMSACELFTSSPASLPGTQPPTSTYPAGEEADDQGGEAEQADIGLDELFGDGEGITPPPITP